MLHLILKHSFDLKGPVLLEKGIYISWGFFLFSHVSHVCIMGLTDGIILLRIIDLILCNVHNDNF